jgi:hypothetical protein
MKEELIKYVMERADRAFQDDFPIPHIEDWIREFIDQYQPDSSKREDSQIWHCGANRIMNDCPCDVCTKNERCGTRNTTVTS